MTNIQTKLLEERMLRALRARMRFRAIVRQVINNFDWLLDDDEDVTDMDNIKRNVTLLKRRKKSLKLLSIKEKGLLRKHADDRTEEEKRHLNKVIGGLKCFRRYPDDVKVKLVGATYFVFYDTGRILVKQNQEAHAMYFLLSGEVNIIQEVWDEIAMLWTTVEIGRKKAGSMFGEVSLLHDVPRTATVVTTAPCELLCLLKEDFDKVLKSTIKQQWDEIQEAMQKCPYFDDWNTVAIRECCLLAKIKTADANQVVFGDGVGKSATSMVYFIVEGKCKVVEHLWIWEKVKNGIKYFKLYEPEEIKREESTFVPGLQSLSHININQDDRRWRTSDWKEPISRIDELLKNLNFSATTLQSARRSADTGTTISIKRSIELERGSKRKSSGSFDSTMNLYNSELIMLRASRIPILQSHYYLPTDVKLHFMQVFTLEEKAMFQDSPFLKNRRVISVTPVKLLLIPAYWLLQHNQGNIWKRINIFLNLRIPKTESVFRHYVEHKKWLDYKQKLREDILAKRKFPNNTTIQDVPYSIRINNYYD